ncbi:TonB-dependent receptor [Aestuariibacter halophilus]|uniref:TonB-dependent receptor n=1 Tax=Fluctibacter halophilus TaxID=226011 RepID=A0ABS8G9Q8_9ALTE|nr:TonB-dependent receptor [Aestuariibacter halophilus]MCC2617270.1 TonB-dependent receptor [Aestuariibacter halophilus]
MVYPRACVIALAISSALTQQAVAQQKPTQKDEESIEQLVVTASPLNRSVLESATPVSVIAGDDLKQRLAPTLGETLKNVPGVHSTYFGPVSSSPVIRGLDGPRIKVVQNGLDVSDVSRVGPDHAVSSEASTATQIEVLRGPATLLYGSGAIGGVVNVVDNRLPRFVPDALEGQIGYLHDTVSNENSLNLNLDGGVDEFAWHVDAFNRSTDDVKLPADAVDDEHDGDTLDNTAIDADGFTVGGGYISDDFRIALSVGRLNSLYGIPGHGHGGEEEHHEDEEGHEEHEEDISVAADLKQDRYQAAIDWLNLQGPFSEVHWHNAYTDYQHQELEDGIPGTQFNNQSYESRLWAKHAPLNGWQGVVGVNVVRSDFEAIGEEAFTPPSETKTLAAFLLEEKRDGDLLWQLGARVERVTLTPDNDFYAEDEHGDEHDDEDHGDEEIAIEEQQFTAVSLSAGVVWQASENQSFAINLARSERAPSAAELFANGPHIGTNTYEVGAFFEVEADADGDIHFYPDNTDIEKEVSTNLDLSYRFGNQHVALDVSLFYNLVDDYLYQQDTGLLIDTGHAHDHEDAEEEAVNALPIFLFRQQDARLYGIEAQMDWHISDTVRVASYADYTRAKLDNDGNVPRIPPLRIGAELHYELSDWHGELSAVHYAKQNKTALMETPTDGYTLINLAVNYYTSFGDQDWVFYLKGNNLTDETARVHTSFLKEDAPLPGRGWVLGTRVTF